MPLTLGGSRRITMKTMSISPSVFYLKNFITDAEADEIINLAKSRMTRSTVAGQVRLIVASAHLHLLVALITPHSSATRLASRLSRVGHSASLRVIERRMGRTKKAMCGLHRMRG